MAENRQTQSTQTEQSDSKYMSFVDSCSRLDDLDYGNYTEWKLTTEDVSVIRQLMILSGALHEHRNEKRQLVKVFRHVCGTNEMVDMINMRHKMFDD